MDSMCKGPEAGGTALAEVGTRGAITDRGWHTAWVKQDRGIGRIRGLISMDATDQEGW